jgi:hypothetical protein
VAVAIALVVVAAAMAVATFGQETGQGGSQASASATTTPASSATASVPEEPLPVPEGNTVVAVLDPAVEKPATSAEQAITLARDTMGKMVGESPYVQLVRMTARNATSRLNGFTGWIILSTDVQSVDTAGGYFPWLSSVPSPTVYATFTWTWVTVDGEVLGTTQAGYTSQDSVPALP